MVIEKKIKKFPPFNHIFFQSSYAAVLNLLQEIYRLLWFYKDRGIIVMNL